MKRPTSRGIADFWKCSPAWVVMTIPNAATPTANYCSPPARISVDSSSSGRLIAVATRRINLDRVRVSL